MKSHTSEFKEEIKTLGKQQSVRITYKENNITKTLTDEDINSATPNYEASLLKSVMKALELDSNISIPKDTEIKFEYGLLVNGAYEYLDYGNYIVAKEPEKQEDTLSYKITCYDKMLYSMKDYEHIDIPYPCTIKQYLVALCNKIGLQFKDSDFANASRQITSELFMTVNEDGTYSSMGYTYRDVLDQIAETTGGCICITLDDKVEVRYINKTINYETSKKSTNIEFESSVKENVKIQELDGKSTQDGTPSPEFPSEIKSVGDDVNLFKTDLENITYKDTQVTHTIDNTNRITTTNSYSWARLEIKYNNLQPNTDYTISSRITNENQLNCGLWGETGNSNVSTNKEFISTIIKKTDNSGILEFYLYTNYSSSTTQIGTVVFDEIKIAKGTEATPYSEYGKGTVTIEQSGKNLWNNSNYETNISTGLEIQDNGFKFTRGTQTGGKYVSKKIHVEKGKTYTFSSNYSFEGTENYLTIYRGSVYGTQVKYSYSQSLTYDSTNDEDLYFTFIIGGSTSNGLAKNIQVEKNSAASSYQPYFSKDYVIPLSAPLRSLPNGTKDTIEEDGIHRRVGSVVLDGSDDEIIGYYSGNTAFYIDGLKELIKKPENNNIINVMSNYFKGETAIHCLSSDYNYCIGFNTNGTLWLRYNTFTTSSELKTWLQQNPTTVQYELSEEVVEPFTDEQLEVINSIETQKGTNIFELESNAILNYPVNYDTINEEYINDTNVNFGEKYRTY